MESLQVCRKTILRDADNLAVWVYIEAKTDIVPRNSQVALLNTEIQAICNEHSSTLDERTRQRNPRPNPTPRIFIEQGNDLSRVLWLHWES